VPVDAVSGSGRAVLLQDSGELGNRLVSYSYLLAFGAEYGIPVTNLCFWRYAHLFERPRRLSELAWAGALLEKLLGLPAFRKHFEFDGQLVCSPRALIERGLVAGAARTPRLVSQIAQRIGLVLREEAQWQHHCSILLPRVLANTTFTDPTLPIKHAALLRCTFCLAPPLRDRLTAYLAPLRQRYDKLVGIHIRRGDYRHYRNGQWYFEDATYRRLMLHLTTLFPEKNVGFIVTTNERFPADRLAGLNAHPGPGHFILDMYALAACDAIAGAPSTFSGWASFFGEKPIYFLEDRERLPALDAPPEIWAPRFY
jgi:hypothetical protein